MLEQQTSLRPVEIISDTAGYSDLIFGLFWILGYQFSPRLADIGGARFWRMNTATDYGALNGVARHRINTRLIAQNWDDILRVAGSLKLGTVRASDLIRALQAGKRPSLLTRAIAEVGRIAKTLYLLAYLDDESYRRRILTQLNRGETRHTLARVVFHGQRGELRQPYREGQEDQLGALGLLIKVLVLGTPAIWMWRWGSSRARGLTCRGRLWSASRRWGLSRSISTAAIPSTFRNRSCVANSAHDAARLRSNWSDPWNLSPVFSSDDCCGLTED